MILCLFIPYSYNVPCWKQSMVYLEVTRLVFLKIEISVTASSPDKVKKKQQKDEQNMRTFL